MKTIIAITTYAATLAAQPSSSAAQIEHARNAAAAALDGAPRIRLRFDGARISPQQAAQKVRDDIVGPLDLRRWARAFEAYERMEHENPKVGAAVAAVPSDFAQGDWLDLALAAIDHASTPVSVQDQIERLLLPMIEAADAAAEDEDPGAATSTAAAEA